MKRYSTQLKTVLEDGKLTLIIRAVLVAVSTIAVITVHETVHLLVGRMADIPAVFTNLTAAGLPKGSDVHQYGPAQLALMNGIAPLLTVVFGFFVYYVLANRRATLGHVRYFFTWWAIFGIPYLGLQMIIIIHPVDYSGNGADSAAVAGYLHLSLLVRAIICLAGFLYYMMSAVWVLGAISAADRDIVPSESGLAVPLWRQMSGWLLIAVAVFSTIWLAVRALHDIPYGPLFLVFGGWGIGTAFLTSWKSSAVKTMWKHWMLPGILGMLALIPLGYDYASMWLLILPPLVAATMFAAHDAFALRTRIGAR
ncbi:MAG: hypothetical protein ACHQAZ_03065 [Gammaproteobacteria bacterium]|jgi:hypothetical protein|nr:hypothetical protein [Gammaproteobacteria bacterium]